MCTVFIAWQHHPQYPLVVASNRDEFHQRPTAGAKWNDADSWFGGRDERDGGSWLGTAKSGRFAVITNYRDPSNDVPDARSRGELVRRWLQGEPATQFIAELEQADYYNGFNLLFGDREQLYYFSNRSEQKTVQTLAPGIYGLSNGLLDEPWPKVRLGKRRFDAVLEQANLDVEVLSGLMRDRRPAPDDSLPSTGVPLALERMLSSLFIVSPGYGTRATTVFAYDLGGSVTFNELRYDPAGNEAGQANESFKLEQD